MAASVVGVDIGNGFIRAVEVLDPEKTRPQIVRFHEIGLPDGAVVRGEVVEPNTVAGALKELWSQGRFGSKDVALGMGNQRVLARDLTVPRASLDHIRESLPFHVQDLLPVPVADALLDFYPVSESTGESGPIVNGLLIAAVKEAVLGNVRAIEMAGLRPVGVDLIPFALCRVLAPKSAPSPSDGADGSQAEVLIDIGANTTSVVIVIAGAPQFVRIIPVGGSDLTDTIQSTLEVPRTEAEALKRRLGLATQAANAEDHRVLEVVYSVTGELLNSLRNTINYYANTRPAETVGRITLAGGGSQLPGFTEALAEMTRIPVEYGDPFSGFALSRKLKAEELRQRKATLAVALGLALWRAA